MEENEKLIEKNERFEKFAKALRELANKAIAEGKDFVLFDHQLGHYVSESRMQRLPEAVEVVIGELRYYLKNQEKIKKELQEPLNKYRGIYSILYEWPGDDDYDPDEDFWWWVNHDPHREVKEINTHYNTYYPRLIHGDDDIIIKKVRSAGSYEWYYICYTYDGSTLTFGIWDITTGDPQERVRIAVDTSLQFRNEIGLKDLVGYVLWYIL